MRTVVVLTLALALGAPVAALAASTSAELQNMVAAYRGVQAVRVVERFENGAVATVDVMPAGQFRVAETGGQDPALVLHVATQPVDGAQWNGTYNVKSLGHKTIEGIGADGYQISAADNSFAETVWVNAAQHLPISAHIQTQGHTIDVAYGDYNDAALVARP